MRVVLLLLHTAVAGSSASCDGFDCFTFEVFNSSNGECVPINDIIDGVKYERQKSQALAGGQCVKSDIAAVSERDDGPYHTLSCDRGDLTLDWDCTDDCTVCQYKTTLARPLQGYDKCVPPQVTPKTTASVGDLRITGQCSYPPISDACTAPGSDCFEFSAYDSTDGTCPSADKTVSALLIPGDGKCHNSEQNGMHFRASCDDEVVTVEACVDSDCSTCIIAKTKPTLAGSCVASPLHPDMGYGNPERDDDYIGMMIKGTCPPNKFPLAAVLSSVGGVLVLAGLSAGLCYMFKRSKNNPPKTTTAPSRTKAII